ncbi:hypothetical protein NLG97_g628 [Lecanicillium saksenae]|uniref:Uncharacterized protein n=1 Tax=Lecanicillium saksenae TaxID=468837 RepID=A0ACC1R8N6_9HYPO|nr:hypothetical protein NLG97_g628 [Lecanicillium saksenae]
MMFIQYLVTIASVASATSFQAWSGDECNGSAGGSSTIGRGGNCEEISGRHSWEVNGDNVKGFYYEGANCAGTSHQFTGSNGRCNNINTGGIVRSMCVVGANNKGCGL